MTRPEQGRCETCVFWLSNEATGPSWGYCVPYTDQTTLVLRERGGHCEEWAGTWPETGTPIYVRIRDGPWLGHNRLCPGVDLPDDAGVDLTGNAE